MYFDINIGGIFALDLEYMPTLWVYAAAYHAQASARIESSKATPSFKYPATCVQQFNIHHTPVELILVYAWFTGWG